MDHCRYHAHFTFGCPACIAARKTYNQQQATARTDDTLQDLVTTAAVEEILAGDSSTTDSSLAVDTDSNGCDTSITDDSDSSATDTEPDTDGFGGDSGGGGASGDF